MIEIASTLSTGKPVRYEYDPEGDLEFLQIGSYIPRRARRAIPLAVVKQPQALPQFA